MGLSRTKKMIIIPLLLLLICGVLLTATSYAWLAISRVPEIVGMNTNVGSNGSLEVALLTHDTYVDPAEIKTRVGDSTARQEAVVSNRSWGNVVNLSDASYGLSEVVLLPTRLNAARNEEGSVVVGTNPLMVPGYGMDGRFSVFHTDTVSGLYDGTSFRYSTALQEYGVRVIGRAGSTSPQQTALASARSAVMTYTNSAQTKAVTVWEAQGARLFDIINRRYLHSSDSFNDIDLRAIRLSAEGMLDALDYINLALRHGIIGFAASTIESTDEFETLRETVANTAVPLSLIAEGIPGSLPAGFADLITTVDSGKLAMRGVISACESMKGGNYAWAQISPLLNELFDADLTYLGERKLSSLNESSQIGLDNVMTFAPGSGVMADVADFTGNYSAFCTYRTDITVEAVTVSTVSPAHLVGVSAYLALCTPAEGNNLISAQMKDTYGYFIDLGFRCNAASDLLLQTVAAQRVDQDSNLTETQGSGSYMEFSSEQLSTEQIVLMMDAVRVGFLDDRNNLLAVAKLNISNYEEHEDGGVAAPLYLYEHTLTDRGVLQIGERLAEDRAIFSLAADTATVLTVIVWLDGDNVDNSLAANSVQSMAGILNLQFASSADLKPADQVMQG